MLRPFELEQLIKELYGRVGKDKGLDALNSVLDHYKEIENNLASYKEPRNGNEAALRSTIVLDESRGIRWLQQFTADIQKMTGVHYHHNLVKNEVTVIVAQPHKLGDAPPGTHEWARGYIMCKNVRAIERHCDLEQIAWQKIEISHDGRRILRVFNEPVVGA